MYTSSLALAFVSLAFAQDQVRGERRARARGGRALGGPCAPSIFPIHSPKSLAPPPARAPVPPRRAPQPAPSQFRGKWVGTVTQSWGQVGPLAIALQCLPQNLSAASTLTIGADGFPFALSSRPASTTTAGANSYTLPAYSGLNGTWAAFAGSTASIRTSASQLECISMQRQGNQLQVLLLGGTGWGVPAQCSPAASQLVPSGFAAPYCKAQPGTNQAPFESTGACGGRGPPQGAFFLPPPPLSHTLPPLAVLGVYTLQQETSGASGSSLSLLLALASIGAMLITFS